jgi:SAM-dependent methyltransferase
METKKYNDGYHTHSDNFRICNLINKRYDKNAVVLDMGAQKFDLINELYKTGFKKSNLFGLDMRDLREDETKQFNLILHNLDNDYVGEENKYDIITAIHVLEHLKRPYNLFDTCAKLLKTGGILIVAYPSFNNMLQRINFLFTGEPFRIKKYNSNNTFITPAMIERFRFGTKVFNIKRSKERGEKPLFDIIESFTGERVFGLFENSRIYILIKN